MDITRNLNYLKFYYFVFVLIIIVFIIYLSCTKRHTELSEFEEFNNESGSIDGCYIIPNIIHFIRLNQPKLTFTEAICILAAYKNHQPDYIFIHTNTLVHTKTRYWKIILDIADLKNIIVFKNIEIPKEIFGQIVNPSWKVYHGGDIARLRILIQYGGIYLDNDSYIVRSLNDFRRYEISIGWKPGKSLQNQVIIAHQNARFLKLWLESYRYNYKPQQWYYNAGQYPTKILEERPYLVHRVEKLFGQYGIVKKMYETKWPEWRHYYTVHLMINHQYLLRNLSQKATYPVQFNESNIKLYPIAFRDMVYDVYPFNIT